MTDDNNPFTKMMTDEEVQRADLIDYLQEVSEHIEKHWPQQRFMLFCFGGCDDKQHCGRSNMTKAERRSMFEMFEHLAISPGDEGTKLYDTAPSDDPAQQRIIEAATLALKLEHSGEGEERERLASAFETAMSQLPRIHHGPMMLAKHLLDSQPFFMASDNPSQFQLCIDLARRFGATVEEGVEHTEVKLTPGTRSMAVYPATWAKQ